MSQHPAGHYSANEKSRELPGSFIQINWDFILLRGR
jgi:hypothetical protein